MEAINVFGTVIQPDERGMYSLDEIYQKVGDQDPDLTIERWLTEENTAEFAAHLESQHRVKVIINDAGTIKVAYHLAISYAMCLDPQYRLHVIRTVMGGMGIGETLH